MSVLSFRARARTGSLISTESALDAATRIRSTTTDQELPDGRVSRSFTAEDGETHTVSSRNLQDVAPGNKLSCAKKARVALIAIFSALGSALFGLDIGYIGPILESSSFKHDVAHIAKEQKLDSGKEGLIVSLFSIGAIVTAFPVISSYFVDTWGRKASITLGSVVFIIASIIQATSDQVSTFLIGRFVAGMSIGLLSSVIVLYQSEVAPASMRGALSTLYQLGITFGILVAAFIDQLLVDQEEGWRHVMLLITIPAFSLIIGMMCLPQSPRWLVQKGRNEEALAVLHTIRSEDEAAQEHLEIQLEVKKAMQIGEPRWSELCGGRVFQLITLGVSLQLIQQLVGMNAFMYFGPKIFESIGFDKNSFTTINNFVNFLSTFPAVALADLAGRRSLMLWSSIGMSIACMIMGVMGLLFVEQREKGGEQTFVVTNESAGWVIAISVFFFVFNFAYGFGPIVWVYCAEIFPLRYSARGVGMCTLANWIGNFLIAQFTPMLLSGIQFNTFFVFGFFCILGVIVAAWLPETKEVPLELIQKLFDDRAWFCRTVAPPTGESVMSVQDTGSHITQLSAPTRGHAH
mmetsp:Transcript_48840/g.105270  ORF Transcript_48840/g.105270 Transcript_48840/m.105270 type:complete len:576 (-) Transcript_48840:157-1884(-)